MLCVIVCVCVVCVYVVGVTCACIVARVWPQQRGAGDIGFELEQRRLNHTRPVVCTSSTVTECTSPASVLSSDTCMSIGTHGGKLVTRVVCVCGGIVW